MKAFLGRFARDPRGTTAIEYGLIGALIFMAIVAGATGFGTEVTALFGRIDTAVTNATP